MKKYELTSETKVINGVELHRIKALKSFGNIKEGDLGGWIESEKILSQDGDAWVGENAAVFENATINGDAVVCGNAKVRGKEDLIVFKNWWSSGRYFTWTRSNNKWNVGCFYGSGEELIAKAYKDSEKSGREYERVVNYVNDILKEEEDNDNGNRNKCEDCPLRGV